MITEFTDDFKIDKAYSVTQKVDGLISTKREFYKNSKELISIDVVADNNEDYGEDTKIYGYDKGYIIDIADCQNQVLFYCSDFNEAVAFFKFFKSKSKDISELYSNELMNEFNRRTSLGQICEIIL